MLRPKFTVAAVFDDSPCVLVAVRHPLLAEGIRGLLESTFKTVVMVADQHSLVESAGRLMPGLAVIDVPLGSGDLGGLIGRLRARHPTIKVLAITSHDEASAVEATLRAGADGTVLVRNIATDLLPQVAAIFGDTLVKGAQV